MLDSSAFSELKAINADVRRLDPKEILEQARSPQSALHRFFTWDDTEAANAFRLHQARHLIHAVIRMERRPAAPPDKVVVHMGERKTVSTLVSVVASAGGKLPFDRALSQLTSDVKELQNEYNDIEGMDEVFDDLLWALKQHATRKREQPQPLPIAPAAGDLRRTVEMVAESLANKLNEFERRIIELMPGDGTQIQVGTVSEKQIRKMWERVPGEIIALSTEGERTYGRLLPIGREIKAILNQMSKAA